MRCSTCFHNQVCRFVNDFTAAEAKLSSGKTSAPFELNCSEFFSKAENKDPYALTAIDYAKQNLITRSMGSEIK